MIRGHPSEPASGSSSHRHDRAGRARQRGAALRGLPRILHILRLSPEDLPFQTLRQQLALRGPSPTPRRSMIIVLEYYYYPR